MHVQVERGQRFAVVRPTGSFYGGNETVDLEHVLGALIDEQLPIVVIDLSRTRDLNSSAIGVLVGAYRRATMRGTTLRLSGADRALQNVLTILKLVNVLPVYDDIEAALAAAMPSRPGSIAPTVAAFAAAPHRI